MSDDRFKQARRSLIDRHNQRQQQGGGWDDSFDGEDFEDEATAMVNLDGQPAFAPPPNFSDADANEVDDGRTEMFSLDQNLEAPPSGVQMRSHSGVQPSYDGFGGPSAPAPQAPQTYSPPATSPATAIGAGGRAPAVSGPAPGGHDSNQSLVIGEGGADFEENTAFINIGSFAQGGEHFTPDSQAAGYEGSTQFVNIAALQAGGPAGATPVEHDAILQQTYQFGPESVQKGDVTLIFAQNQQGKPVVLKRVWEGDPNGMPIPVRQRIAALDAVRHPRLAGLNGMIAAPSGAWVELDRPPGYRLTDIINQNGPQDPATVMGWVQQTAEILSVIHGQAFVYANLTTDAIWIQDDGSVILEPFDVLAYEMRGSLGAFGPPELNLPADQQQRTPATDVYSLAAVTVAAMTGLPLNLGAIDGLEKNVKGAVTAALNQDAAQRPPDAMAFVATAHGKRAGKAGKSGGPSKVMMAIPVIVVLGVVGLGAAYMLRPAPNNGVTTPPPTTIAELPSSTNTMETGTTGAVVVAASAGDVELDPRLVIQTSFATNPPADSGKAHPEDLEEAALYREEARELVTDVDTLQESARRERYSEALAKLADAARLSGGMTAADEELFEELSASSIVSEIRKDYFDRLDTSLKEERISRVKQVYPQLAAVDAEATELRFFVKNKAVDIKTIEPIEE